MKTNHDSELRLAIEFCREVISSGEDILGQLSIKSGEHFKLLMASKVLRARALFLGAINLAELKLTSPASALIRCMMEVKFVAVALSINRDWAQDLIEADESHRARAMRRLLALPEEHRAANVKTDVIQEQLNSIFLGGRGVSVADWAKRAKCEDEYQLAYMLLSEDVHASLRGSEAHLVLNEQGKACGLSAYPEVDALPFRLMHACDTYLTILSALPDGVIGADGMKKLQSLFADDRKLGIGQRALREVERRDLR